MAREILIKKQKAPRGRRFLPDPVYYLNNFQMVVAALDERYTELLSSEERQFITLFGALPQPSRALLVRMVMRQGVFFRASRLNYPEIGETAAAVAPLLKAGWIDERPDLDVNRLQQLLTKAELLQYFAPSRLYRTLKKPDLVVVLGMQYPESKPFDAWCKASSDRVYQLNVGPLCERFRLMFFGNFHQDWNEFVLTDLGVFNYEKIPSSLQSRPFHTRIHIEVFQQLYRCRQWLDAGLDLDWVIEAIPQPIADCEWLEDHRQRLLFQIGRAYERRGESRSALAAYSTCTHRGARLRIIRLHERAHEWELARNLCLIAEKCPENDTECQQLRRLLARLNRKLGVSNKKPCDSHCVSTFEMALDTAKNEYAVEYYVRDRLAQQAPGNTTIHYVENGLVNSLFGLLCWKAIFAPIPGAFFHDFQRGPADLLSDHFYHRRHREFTECFAELESDQYKTTIRQRFAAKAGIQCPFVAWGLLNTRLLDWALTCFPAAHLRLWFEWIVQDVQKNRTGFPDLVQFWPLERRYRMIEVKGPGDRLQDNQRRLLEFCSSHDMPVAVCNVRREHF